MLSDLYILPTWNDLDCSLQRLGSLKLRVLFILYIVPPNMRLALTFIHQYLCMYSIIYIIIFIILEVVPIT